MSNRGWHGNDSDGGGEAVGMVMGYGGVKAMGEGVKNGGGGEAAGIVMRGGEGCRHGDGEGLERAIGLCAQEVRRDALP